MAIKTFTTGEVLTASDTNTYLANSGLVFVKSQTIGSGVASVTVSDAFNSTYDAYKIVATNVSASAGGTVSFALGGITTGWYGNLVYSGFVSGTVLSSGYNNVANITHAGGSNTSLIMNVEIINPFLTKMKYLTSHFIDTTNAGNVVALNNQTTSATAFTITAVAGSFTGGQLTVYGFRKG
jgi:hypothetical protein